MNILIIGGTRFQGRYLVKELLDAGHTVTVFHRGGHTLDSQPGLIDLLGDRNVPSDLARLAGQRFDACIDTCAYFPAQVDLLASVLRVGHYCLISTVYVYADRDALLDERAPLDRTPVAQGTALTPQNYGALKVHCEEAALARFGNTSLSLRPSIIIGMGDHTERLLFWMRLASVHGKRLDISDRSPVVQLVDVRDLAHFTARCIETGRQGAVNVCGESASHSALLDSIASITGRQLACESVREEELTKLGLARLPYCEGGHLARHDTALSRDWGFGGRDLRDSLADIHADCLRHGFSMHGFRDEEAAVLRLFA